MGQKSKKKAERREERRNQAISLAVFAEQLERMLQIAHLAFNYVDTTKGENPATKMGKVPDPNGDGLIPAMLKDHLSVVLKLPSWSTHWVVTYTVDLVLDGAGSKLIGGQSPIRRMRHLSVTMHAPIRATTDELRRIKDQWVQATFPTDFLNLFFPDLDGVLVAVRAGPFETSGDENDDTTWTPVTTHFYVDHDAPPDVHQKPPSRLLGPDGRPL